VLALDPRSKNEKITVLKLSGGELIVMGKRKMINFARPGADQYEDVEEEGMPKPCAMGIPWVNPDTLSTLEKRKINRTGPKGEQLPEARKA
jgi:hypothetical protein